MPPDWAARSWPRWQPARARARGTCASAARLTDGTCSQLPPPNFQSPCPAPRHIHTPPPHANTRYPCTRPPTSAPPLNPIPLPARTLTDAQEWRRGTPGPSSRRGHTHATIGTRPVDLCRRSAASDPPAVWPMRSCGRPRLALFLFDAPPRSRSASLHLIRARSVSPSVQQ